MKFSTTLLAIAVMAVSVVYALPEPKAVGDISVEENGKPTYLQLRPMCQTVKQ